MRARLVRWGRWALVTGAATAIVAAGTAGPASAAPTTTRVSSSAVGGPGNGPSDVPAVSADGRYVTFQSSATNLVAGDTNFQADVFLRDRLAGTTERVSVGTGGVQGNRPSGLFQRSPMTPDGRYVAFQSFAFNLVPDDTNGVVDVFVRDRLAGATTRVSVGYTGQQADGASSGASITSDGRYVMFTSAASNLVPGDTNGRRDVFVRDLKAGTTRRVSVRQDGGQTAEDTRGWCMSADGRYVGFESFAAYVPGDTNNSVDAYVKDLMTGAVERVSLDTSGRQFPSGSNEMSMSADGRMVTFTGYPGNIVPQLYVRDRTLKRTALLSVNLAGSPGNRSSFAGSISADGRYAAFTTGADDMAPGAPFFANTYVRDLPAGRTILASVTSTGTPIRQSTNAPAMSDVGVVFVSFATDVVPDGNPFNYAQLYFRSR